MSQISEVCDYVKADLVSSIPGLAEAEFHLYVPWDPAELQADAGERHVGLWPLVEGETSEPLSFDSHELSMPMACLVWEDASGSQDRRVVDTPADLAFLELWQEIRARFYSITNMFGGGSERTWYDGTTFPDDVYLTRWFRVQFSVRHYQPFGA